MPQAVTVTQQARKKASMKSESVLINIVSFLITEINLYCYFAYTIKEAGDIQHQGKLNEHIQCIMLHGIGVTCAVLKYL